MPERIRIATRNSPLALWQAETVATRLRDAHPGLAVALVPITSEGDQRQDVALSEIGGKGLFVKTLEVALLDGRADIAVHSMKDVTAFVPDGLVIDTVLERGNPLDAFVSHQAGSIDQLAPGSRIGTCSPRRQAQLRARFPALEFLNIRGNVGTRLSRLDDGEFDAIILACAGLERLALQARIASTLDPDISLPAVGQGIVGIESRADDSDVRTALAAIHHEDSYRCLLAERAFCAALDGTCTSPIATFATLAAGGELALIGRVIAADGSATLEARTRGSAAEAEAIGRRAAEDVIGQGAREVLAAADRGGQH